MADRLFRFSFQRFLKISWTDQLDAPAGLTRRTDQVDWPAGRTSWTDRLDGPAGRISWMDQLDESAGRISSLYLKPWPVCISEDCPFSLYIVADSESDEGLVCWKLSFPAFVHNLKNVLQLLSHFPRTVSKLKKTADNSRKLKRNNNWPFYCKWTTKIHETKNLELKKFLSLKQTFSFDIKVT